MAKAKTTTKVSKAAKDKEVRKLLAITEASDEEKQAIALRRRDTRSRGSTRRSSARATTELGLGAC